MSIRYSRRSGKRQMADYGIRAVVALVVVVICACSWMGARSRLQGWYRLPLDYTLGLYALTYGIGCVILFVFQVDYIVRYYSGAGLIPARVSYPLILAVAAMPFLFVPSIVVALASIGPERTRA